MSLAEVPATGIDSSNPWTVGSGCFVGVDIVGSAETPELVSGYGRFRDKMLALDSAYLAFMQNKILNDGGNGYRGRLHGNREVDRSNPTYNSVLY